MTKSPRPNVAAPAAHTSALPRRRAVMRRLVGASLLLGCLPGTGCARQAVDTLQPSTIPPAGQVAPDPRLAENAPAMSTETEVTLDGYGMMVPAGMKRERIFKRSSSSTETTLRWLGPLRPDKTRTRISWHCFQANANVLGLATERLPQLLAAYMQHNATLYPGQVTSPLQRFALHGLPAVRCYWKGFSPEIHKTDHGFVILTADEQAANYIRAFDCEPHNKKSLPVCEKAALTFHKL